MCEKEPGWCVVATLHIWLSPESKAPPGAPRWVPGAGSDLDSICCDPPQCLPDPFEGDISVLGSACNHLPQPPTMYCYSFSFEALLLPLS